MRAMDEREISPAVIDRLPRYFRYLGVLKEDGVEKISSQELSSLMNVTASQIRQDLNNFGGFGQQGYGYNVEYLHEEIGKILGLDKQHNLIVMGAGKLGQALINYMMYRNRGFLFKGAFDTDASLWGRTVGDIRVFPPEKLEEFIRDNHIDIAVLTLPKTEAQATAERLAAAGIRAIWNFAHVDLKVPGNVLVENVHLQDSLLKLSYKIHSYERDN